MITTVFVWEAIQPVIITIYFNLPKSSAGRVRTGHIKGILVRKANVSNPYNIFYI